MNYNNKAVEIISTQILEAVDKKMSTASFDITYNCTVKEKLGDNKYIVSAEGKDFTITTSHLLLQLFDKVHIIYPKNNSQNIIVLEDLIYTCSKTDISGDADLTQVYKQIDELSNQINKDRTIDGVDFNNIEAITHYATCTTSASIIEKTVILNGFKLMTGSRVSIKFTTTNTASNPTLNINNTGAKPIIYKGNTITAGYLSSNCTYEFIYNDGNYELVGDVNTDTTYSAGTGLTLSGTQFKHSNSITAGTVQGDITKILSFGDTFTIPSITYDAQGHITSKSSTTMTMPSVINPVYMRVGLSSNFSVSTANTITVMPCTKLINTDSSTEIIQSGNGIKINSDNVKAVQIQARLYYNGTIATSTKNIFIYLNETQIARDIQYVSSNYVSLSVSVLIPVSVGDIITMRVNSQITTPDNISSDSATTFLAVHRI